MLHLLIFTECRRTIPISSDSFSICTPVSNEEVSINNPSLKKRPRASAVGDSVNRCSLPVFSKCGNGAIIFKVVWQQVVDAQPRRMEILWRLWSTGKWKTISMQLASIHEQAAIRRFGRKKFRIKRSIRCMLKHQLKTVNRSKSTWGLIRIPEREFHLQLRFLK